MFKKSVFQLFKANKQLLKSSRITTEEARAKLDAALSTQRAILSKHPLYSSFKNLEDLKTFQEHHIICVYDFMALLKKIQQMETTLTVPWYPPKNTDNARFINEIVLGEETDEFGHKFISHYDFYLQGMAQTGAHSIAAEELVEAGKKVKTYEDMKKIIDESKIPEAAKVFTHSTFNVVFNGKPHEVVGLFCLGREELIPDMFQGLLNDIKEREDVKIDILVDYIERHIEIDGGSHGKLSWQLLCSHCGDDPQLWQDVEDVAIKGLKARIALWDAVLERIKQKDITENEVKLVQDNWDLVVSVKPNVMKLFYENLFTLAPSVISLFKGDPQQQEKKLFNMVNMAVKNLKSPEKFLKLLEESGKRHVKYGAVDDHYPVVGKALVKTLDQIVGGLDYDTKKAWAKVYQFLQTTMINASKKIKKNFEIF